MSGRLDILVTGFGPFPHVRINPTAVLARAVARRLHRHGLAAASEILETSYAGGLPRLRAVLRESEPRAVLMLGLAARARWVRVELYGRGRASPLHPDRRGEAPGSRAAGSGLPRATTANAQGALAILRRHGLRTQLSPSAGRYLCDASYALALGETAAPVLFVHIPWLREPPGRRPRPRALPFRPPPERLAQALAEIGLAMARLARMRRQLS